MKINSLNVPNLSPIKSDTTKTDRIDEKKPSTQAVQKPDVHNMSPDELKKFAISLYESGKISNEDALRMSGDATMLALFGDTANDQKIDMTSYFEKRIETLKQLPGTKGIEYVERTLDILKSYDASLNADLPKKV